MASTSSIVDITTEESFSQAVAGKSACVHFEAAWCAPCVEMNKICAQLAVKYPQVAFFKLDAENLSNITEKFGIAAVPAFVFLRNGVEMAKLEGANPPLLSKHVADLADAANLSKTMDAKPVEGINLTERLTKLVNMAPVVLFMKGTAQQPRCGFSRQVVELLNKNQVPFETFDILSDENVRQGLKTFSNWPTYPQLYAKGKLIGGLDIARELSESGDLHSELGIVVQKSYNTDEALKGLVNSSPIMLFMKGTPEAPKCGFSTKMVELLKRNNVAFGSFDILSDENVRSGLKTLYNWPTFPQLYCKGKLVGGLDIARELEEGGELYSALEME